MIVQFYVVSHEAIGDDGTREYICQENRFTTGINNKMCGMKLRLLINTIDMEHMGKQFRLHCGFLLLLLFYC